METTMTTMVSSDFVFPIKRKMTLPAQDSLKPCIFRTKGEPSTRNFFPRLVHRKMPAPPVLCRSNDSLDDDKERQQTTFLDDGKRIAEKIRGQISSKVLELNRVTGKVPKLAIVYVAEAPWKNFVDKLVESCKKTGIDYVTIEMHGAYTKNELKDVLNKLNEDSTVHAIHVQDKDDRTHEFNRVNLDKDIDGNRLMKSLWDLLPKDEEPVFFSPPAKGILEFLVRSVKDLKHKRIVVVGTTLSAYQMAFLLRRNNFLFEFFLPFSPFYQMRKAIDMIRAIKQADIVIHDSEFQLRQHWLKQKPIVLEVGTCPENTVSEEMTITMILLNTLDAAAKQIFA